VLLERAAQQQGGGGSGLELPLLAALAAAGTAEGCQALATSDISALLAAAPPAAGQAAAAHDPQQLLAARLMHVCRLAFHPTARQLLPSLMAQAR
jgi:hypothetical protein